MANPPAIQSDTLEGFTSLNLIRQLGLMLGLAASVAIGFAVVLWAQGGDYRPLYGNLERVDSAEILQILDSQQIDYKIDQSSGALLVESDKIHQARIQLAAAGMPADNTVGFELLDQEQPLGTSQFMETARYRRSLEGELGRTIASISSVRAARVHLAVPKESVFVRDGRKPSASVLVDVYPGQRVTREHVKAISNLVASSVPEMGPEQVTVVDQKGALLSELTKEEPEFAMANRQLEYTRKLEERLVKRINSILEPLVGEGKFRAEVAADVDFTAVEQTDEIYNPDLPAVRSEQTIAERRGTGEAVGGVPGALSNQPPPAGEAPQAVDATTGEPLPAGSGRMRNQVVRNYELDRTISHTRHQVGRVRRLTVAVAVDDMDAQGEEGAESRPWDPNELERLTILVKDAVGYDPVRGDSVNVINSPFQIEEPAEELVIEEPPIWQQPWVMDIGKQLLGALFVLVLIFGVLRPVMKSLSQSARETREFDAQRSLAELGGGESNTAVGGQGNMMLPGPDDNYDQNLNQIKGMIAEDPGRVAQVVRTWVASD